MVTFKVGRDQSWNVIVQIFGSCTNSIVTPINKNEIKNIFRESFTTNLCSSLKLNHELDEEKTEFLTSIDVTSFLSISCWSYSEHWSQRQVRMVACISLTRCLCYKPEHFRFLSNLNSGHRHWNNGPQIGTNSLTLSTT